jgi:uncharacterized protein YukE
MAFEGMDPDQVESLGRQLQHQESALHGIISQLDGLVNSMATNWLGQDSTRFQHSWSGQYRTQLTRAAQQLGTLGSHAISNASEQRRTSA